MNLEDYFKQLDTISAEITALRAKAKEIREEMSIEHGPWLISKVCIEDINSHNGSYSKGFTLYYHSYKGAYNGFYPEKQQAAKYDSPRAAAEILDCMVVKPFPAKGEPRCPHTRYGKRDPRWVYRVESYPAGIYLEM